MANTKIRPVKIRTTAGAKIEIMRIENTVKMITPTKVLTLTAGDVHRLALIYNRLANQFGEEAKNEK